MGAYIEIGCHGCTQIFSVALREVRRVDGKYCSRSFSSKYNKRPLIPNVKCAFCFTEFYKNNTTKKQSRSGLYFCKRTCKDAAQRIGGIKEIMPPHYGLGNGKNSYREDAIRHYGAKCNRCSFDKNIHAIVVHHKDRDRLNNLMSNLEVLCANCHAIEHWGE